ncbi:MAG: hypothetical protein PWP24_1937 [Clostridiales bacterium]|nr:hypothetical protein [Clostridiales bacterium]
MPSNRDIIVSQTRSINNKRIATGSIKLPICIGRLVDELCERGYAMYQKFRKLIDERGITAYRVSMDTGIAQSCLSDWKNGRSKPKIDKLIILADYLGVPLEDLIDRRDKTEVKGENG